MADKSDKIQFIVIVSVLAVAGIALALYKHIKYNFPLTPQQTQEVWTVEAKIQFTAKKDVPVSVSLAVPGEQRTLTLLEEDYASTGYSFVRTDDPSDQILHRRVEWARKSASGRQTLYYRVAVTTTSANAPNKVKPDPLELSAPDWTEQQQASAKKIFAECDPEPTDDESLIRQLLSLINRESFKSDVAMLTGDSSTILARARLAQQLLYQKDVQVHLVRGFELEEGQSRRVSLQTYLAYFNEKASKWQGFSIDETELPIESNYLIWQRGGQSLLEVTGAEDKPQITFTSMSDAQRAYQLSKNIAMRKGGWLFDFSIYSLPLEQQTTFKMLFLVPIGALIVVIMRSVVGLKTSGTFMPILIAMAFVNTRLMTGLFLFVVIVSAGLLIRSYLSRLNLLLVPRISAVLVVVLILMAVMSILSHKFGIQQGMRATLFPMIILSWTVERLSIAWEEEGPRDVLIQTLGSLVVAIITYGVMSSRHVSHLMFSFPELLLTLLAIIMLLGQYTGYRLSELMRFSSFAKRQKEA
ncbi:MAG: inactive transglutaminase family protein [Planctomycetota bacterium]|jgi:hypothetical protein